MPPPSQTTEVGTAPLSSNPVAKVGSAEYETLDDAVEKAPDGATIELLGDATTEGLNLSKDLTIQAADGLASKPTITFTKYGIALWGKSLTFKDCNVVMNKIGSTPYTAEWNWMAICASKDASLSLDNVDMTMDAAGTTNSPHAIYFCNNNVLNITNGSKLTIKNYPNDALEWDGGNGGYNVNITDSAFVSDHNRSGFTGTFVATFTNSSVDVINSTGNGSNGSHFEIDNSQVNFSDNGSHGLSAGRLVIKNHSVVTADHNGMRGVTMNSDFEMDGTSTLNVTRNSWKGDYAGLKTPSGGTGHIASGATVSITDNYCSGLSNGRDLTIDEGAHLAITGNVNNQGAGHGGGIYSTGSSAKLTLPSDAVICNNHAKTDGDDIYSTGTITFGQTGSDWKLDGDDKGITSSSDCTDSVDGWYLDSKGSRWNAHADDYSGINVERYAFDGSTTTVTGSLALKAAHGLGTVTVVPADITIYMGGDKGYQGVVDGSDQVTESNSLPEPGFYFTLPDDVNEALQAAGITPEGEAADLSEYMKIYTHDYAVEGVPATLDWRVERYGASYSGAYDKFIYRLVPVADGGALARLEFTSQDGSQTFTSDNFDPSNAGALDQQYNMQLYAGLVDNGQVVFEIDVPSSDGSASEKYYSAMELGTGTLTIRYVTGSQDDVVTDVVTSEAELADVKAENPDKAYALVSDGNTFYINDSEIDVTASAVPSLLFDEVVSSGNTGGAPDYDQQLESRALSVLADAGTSFANPQSQARYLDLVDAGNGNVWLTSEQPVTVYWPYPEGTDESTEFHLVHFKGLDREISNDKISGEIGSCETEAVSVENTEYGIRFNATDFSPFVLTWDGGSEPGDQPSGDQPSGDQPSGDQPSGEPSQSKPSQEQGGKGDEANDALPGTGDSSRPLTVGVLTGLVLVGIAIRLRKGGHATR